MHATLLLVALASLVASGCSSAPALGDEAESPTGPSGADRPARVVAAPLVDRDFLLGSWGPTDDPLAAEARIRTWRERGKPAGDATLAAYSARLALRANGTGTFALGLEGRDHVASELRWRIGESLARTHDELEVLFELADGGRGMSCFLKRDGEELVLRGDAFLAGRWTRLQRGAQADAEDRASFVAASQHTQRLAEARRREKSLRHLAARRHHAYATLLGLVEKGKTQLAADNEAALATSNEEFESTVDALREIERAMLRSKSANAPRSPVPTALEDAATAPSAKDLLGTWAVAPDLVDMEVLLARSPREARDRIRRTIVSRQRQFSPQLRFARGRCLDSVEARPGERVVRAGIWVCVAGTRNWSSLAIRHQVAGGEDLETRVEIVPVFRVGDVLWIGEADGPVLPYRRRLLSDREPGRGIDR